MTDAEQSDADRIHAEHERHKAEVLAALLLLVGLMSEDLQAEDPQHPSVAYHAFGVALRQDLLAAHQEAARHGRLLATIGAFGGEAGPVDEASEAAGVISDKALAAKVMDGEKAFITRFVADLQAGRYTDEEGSLKTDAVNARVALYVRQLATTANRAFVANSDEESLWDWVLDHPEESCDQCPEWAAGSPYLRDEIPAVPGDGTSDCSIGCRCVTVRSDGVEGFSRED